MFLLLLHHSIYCDVVLIPHVPTSFLCHIYVYVYILYECCCCWSTQILQLFEFYWCDMLGFIQLLPWLRTIYTIDTMVTKHLMLKCHHVTGWGFYSCYHGYRPWSPSSPWLQSICCWNVTMWQAGFVQMLPWLQWTPALDVDTIHFLLYAKFDYAF